MENVSIGRVSDSTGLDRLNRLILIVFRFVCSTTTEKFLRENARREESTLRHHAHAMHMNMMRSRVKSAQLLLEGRSLTAK